MPKTLRFPSGATIDQVKKDAKKHAKTNGIPLNQSLNVVARVHGLDLPWHLVGEWLERNSDSRPAIATFELPVADGQRQTIKLTTDQPLVVVCGVLACGKSTAALVFASQAMATSSAKLYFVTYRAAGWPPEAWDEISKAFPGRCVEVGGVDRFDLSHINPDRGDLVILDERFHSASHRSIQDLVEHARSWEVGLFVCKQGQIGDREFEVTGSAYCPGGGVALIAVGTMRIRQGQDTTFKVSGNEPTPDLHEARGPSWSGEVRINRWSPQSPAITPR